MKTIKGQKFLTIHATAGEVYEVSYTVPPKISVSNNTSGGILIGADAEFTDSGTSGSYISVAEGAAVNNVSTMFAALYIKAESDGDIVIVRCG